MTGNRKERRLALELATAENISYTEALRRVRAEYQNKKAT